MNKYMIQFVVNALLASFVGFLYRKESPAAAIAVLTIFVLNGMDRIINRLDKQEKK